MIQDAHIEATTPLGLGHEPTTSPYKKPLYFVISDVKSLSPLTILSKLWASRHAPFPTPRTPLITIT
jgi:hypothetical protein